MAAGTPRLVPLLFASEVSRADAARRHRTAATAAAAVHRRVRRSMASISDLDGLARRGLVRIGEAERLLSEGEDSA